MILTVSRFGLPITYSPSNRGLNINGPFGNTAKAEGSTELGPPLTSMSFRATPLILKISWYNSREDSVHEASLVKQVCLQQKRRLIPWNAPTGASKKTAYPLEGKQFKKTVANERINVCSPKPFFRLSQFAVCCKHDTESPIHSKWVAGIAWPARDHHSTPTAQYRQRPYRRNLLPKCRRR